MRLLIYASVFVSIIEWTFDVLFSDTPSPMASRTLTMVAKCLQNLANLIEFGAEVLNRI